MSLFPTVLQTQPAFAIDAIQKNNSAYYFIPTDASGGGGGSTSLLVSPVIVDTSSNFSPVNVNGIICNSDNTNSAPFGYVVQDINPGTETMIALVAEGNTATLQLGNAGQASSYFVQGQGGSAIGNTDSFGTALNLISWNPVGPSVTLKLNNPTRITGPSGDGIPYDTIYNPLPPPVNPPVPEITSNTAPISIASWNADLTVASSDPAALDRGGLYLVIVSVRIGVGVTYNFPAGSILNLTPVVSGTQDPYNSMTFFLSSTTPQGSINTTQSGLGFYTQGDVISGQLNQASSGAINLGPGGGIDMFIQQVINEYP
jgi:hypothetical protein